jgi:hypothetical protein
VVVTGLVATITQLADQERLPAIGCGPLEYAPVGIDVNIKRGIFARC